MVLGKNRPKISVIGVGQIGSLVTYFLSQKELGDVVLFDIVPTMPMGKALDQNQAAAIQNLDSSYTGTNSYEDTKDSDVVVVIAGVPRKPGMSRDDLVSINAKVMKDVGTNIKKYSPNAFVICVTNPLDVMVHLLWKFTGLPSSKVVGMAGVLDSARFKSFLAEKLDVSVKDVSTIVLGGHGDSMVPVPRMTSVGGIPLPDLIDAGMITQKDVDDLVTRTRHGGAEVLGLLQTGSAFHAPAAAVVEMVESYLRDKKRLLPCAAYLNGEYGYSKYFVGVPCVIGSKGVEKIIELKLKPEEKELFDASAQHVIKMQQSVDPEKI